MKKKILAICVIILLIIAFVAVYWFLRGDACLTQPPYFNCHTQNRFNEIDSNLSNLSSWLESVGEPSVFNINKNEDVFSFNHIKGEGGVGWTRIMKNKEIEDSLGFYTNYIDPTLVPLSENTLIGSAWQWPRDSKLYNGPFFNYYLDFNSRKTIELTTKGRFIAKSDDGQKVVFLESACTKERLPEEQFLDCNNLDLSLRLIHLAVDFDGFMINHYYYFNSHEEEKFLDFGKVVFSPDKSRLAIEVKIESIDYDTANEYWTILIANVEDGSIIKRDNRLSKNKYEHILWSDNENIIYW